MNNFSRNFTMNPLFVSLIYYEFIIDFANLLWIHYFFASSLWIYFLYYEFTANLVDFSSIYFEFIINYANSLWIHLLFCDLQWIYLLFQVQYEFTLFRGIIIFFANLSCDHKLTICFTISLWIYYLFRKSTIN